MKKVFLLVGHSGTGKTEIAKWFTWTGYDVLQSYTTRAKRYENEYGHLFCNVEEYELFKANDDIVAYSLFDGNHYFSTKKQIYTTDCYVVDPDGINDLKSKIKDIEFVTIYIQVDEDERVRRMLARGDSEEKVKGRLIVDALKFIDLTFDYAVSNKDLDKTLKIIKHIVDVELEDER